MESNYNMDYKPRIVENHIQMAVIEENKIDLREFWRAFGYLSNWASHSDRYKVVRIMHDDLNGDMLANFYEKVEDIGKTRPNYQIGAIWRSETKEYTFHS
jgi:hypothetical protein